MHGEPRRLVDLPGMLQVNKQCRCGMTDRQRGRRVLVIALAAWAVFAQSQYALPPCDVQASAMAEEPTSADAEVSVVVPSLRFEPRTAPPGTIVKLIYTPPASDTVVVNWLDHKWGKEKIDATTWFVAPLPGENVACMEVMWTTGDPDEPIKRKLIGDTHTCGEPPPPKPLAELVTPEQRSPLADAYLRLAQMAFSFRSSEHFWANHDALLESDPFRPFNLKGHGATERVKATLAPLLNPVDIEKLGVALREISAAFGEPPKPEPVQPPGPGTPVTFDGFHVVFVHESGAQERMAVYNLTAAKALDAYLDSHCTNGAHGWRVWDQNAVLDNAPPHFKEMMALPRSVSPALVVAAGKQAAVLPLPASPEDAVAILKRWGGE